MSIKIALAGNPNCGKTTMFNGLTGSSQYVGNWPGVTVEKKEGKLKGNKDIEIIDLPGIYSLSPYTMEEVVTRNYLITESPDAIIDIIDTTNIERNLYLYTQLMELGIPVIVALNMMDIVRKKGDSIDIKKLGKKLGCEVIETSALKDEGCTEAVEKVLEVLKQTSYIKPSAIFSSYIESALNNIKDIISPTVDNKNLRWFTVKVFERDKKVFEHINLPDDEKEKIEQIIKVCEEKLDDDSESIIINERYAYIDSVIKQCVVKNNKTKITTSQRIDNIMTSRILAIPIFAIVMFVLYYLSISTIGKWGSDWINDVLFGKIITPGLQSLLESAHSATWLSSLILDGIVGGVGSVLAFIPQILVLFFFLAILEDCGYMARIAFILDRIFRNFGLSGKSFIPILIGTGCGVPGIMASRTIENENDRKVTIITTTFIPCSAKLPIIALIAGAMFPGSSLVAPSAYFAGIAAIIMSGIILKKLKKFTGNPSPFVMELPPYHLPGLKNVLIHTWDRGKSFLKKAGTVIFLASGIIWFLSSFDWSMHMVDASKSILASIGSLIAPIFSPLGWGDWKPTVAAITGIAAKENVVGTFGVLYGSNDSTQVWNSLQASFTQLSAYSFLIFNLLCAPCIAAIAAIRREMGNVKWTLFAVGYQTGFAYAISFIIYQLGMVLSGKSISLEFVFSLLITAVLLFMLFKPNNKAVHYKPKEEYSWER